MAKTKATKKFEQRHLSDTLKRRKDFAKVKQRNQLKEKRKARRAEDYSTGVEGENEDAPNGDDVRPRKKQKQDSGALADMSVDDFFAGGFTDLPKPPSKSSKKQKRSSQTSEDSKEANLPSDDSSGDDQDYAFAESDAEAGNDQSDDDEDPLSTHRNDLQALERDDPEFYKYLKENDAELLDEFTDLAELDELSDGEDKAMPDEVSKTSKKSSKSNGSAHTNIPVTAEMVKKWSESITTHNSIRAARDVVLAFRWIAHSQEDRPLKYRYSVTDRDAYLLVINSALREVPVLLNRHHLPLKELPNGKLKYRFAPDSKKSKGLINLIKSHMLSVQHFLQTQSEESFLGSALYAIRLLLPYALSFKKVLRNLTKAVVETWMNAKSSTSIVKEAFQALRSLVTISDAGIQQDALRTSYQGLITGSKNPTVHNLARLETARNSLAELWGVAESNVSYTTAFTFIRQLAIHLRKSIKDNSNDSYKTVYNWQYVKSLDFWSVLLSIECSTLREATNGRESPLRPLIYPLTQVTLGAMRLIPTASYFPLRFHLTAALCRVSSSTNTFIPLATPLYEVLTSKEMKRPPKPSTLKPVDFETSIRVSKTYLRTRVYQDAVGEEVSYRLAEYFSIWCKSIAFPELALPVIVMIKRWLREVSPYSRGANGPPHKQGKKGKSKGAGADTGAGGNRNHKVNNMISLLVSKLEANSRFIEERRAKVDFAPNDRAGVEAFLKETPAAETPLGAFVAGQKQQREERKRVIEESRREEEDKRKKEEDEKEKDRQMGGFSGSDVSEEEEEAEGEYEDEEELEMEMEDEMDGEDLEEEEEDLSE